MSKQNSKPAQPCVRCHGSGRVGYVMADGRRGKYRCPECRGFGFKPSETPTIPKVVQAPANAPAASNEQERPSWEAALEPFVGSVDWDRVWREGLSKLLTAPDAPPKATGWYDDSRNPGYGKAFDDAWEAWTWE